MNHKPSLKLMILTLLLASFACGLSDLSRSTPQPQPTPDLKTAVARSLAETAGMQTAIAQGVAGTIGPGQQGIPQDSTQSQPELPSLTPSLELSPSSEKALVSVSQVTNCRSGPGSSYDWLGALDVGEQAEVFGRDPSNTSWYIRNPNNSSGFCWIYGAFATVTGNTSILLVYTPIPSPTPAKTATSITAPVDFTFTFLKFYLCGSSYVSRYTIYNNSAVTWQSYQLTTTDTVTAETKTLTDNKFSQLIACVVQGVFQDDLTPGESGEVWINVFWANPSGHLISATTKLCTLDNLGGTCMTKTITFTAP